LTNIIIIYRQNPTFAGNKHSPLPTKEKIYSPAYFTYLGHEW